MITLAQYEKFVDDEWKGGSPEYTMIALAGEAGEACNAHKKGMRQTNDPRFDPDWRAHKLEELGDLLYYLTRACHDERISLATVMNDNHLKLIDRNKNDKQPTPTDSGKPYDHR